MKSNSNGYRCVSCMLGVHGISRVLLFDIQHLLGISGEFSGNMQLSVVLLDKFQCLFLGYFISVYHQFGR